MKPMSEPMSDERLAEIKDHVKTGRGMVYTERAELAEEIERLRAELQASKDELEVANEGTQFYNRKAADALILLESTRTELQAANKRAGSAFMAGTNSHFVEMEAKLVAIEKREADLQEALETARKEEEARLTFWAAKMPRRER